MPGIVNVFADLSDPAASGFACHHTIEQWAQPERLGAIARRVNCVVPVGSLQNGFPQLNQAWVVAEAASPLAALNNALATAGRDGVPLLLLIGPVNVSSEGIGVMHQCLERDPMFGFAVPRIGCADRCCFARLRRHGMGDIEWLPRNILAELPDQETLVEVAAPCLLIGPQVLSNFGPLDRQFENIAAAMLHYMAGARRCGFRTVLCNRALVGIDDLTCHDTAANLPSGLPPHDLALLDDLVPEFERSWDGFRAGSWERFERLCTSRVDRPAPPRPSLLLDVRNAIPIFNGTTQAILGTLNGLKEIDTTWEVALLADADGARFHDFARVYAQWRLDTTLPDRSFTVAVRLSQPWHIQEMVDLHRVALVNAYMMLDTIAWDIAYPSPHLDGTWQFLADHADAFLFDSDFTRQRFVERFAAARSLPSVVTHFSLDENEYIRSDVPPADEEDFILVVGNSLDHKDVRQTVEALASAFPFRRIEVMGPSSLVSPLVSAHNSGELPESDVHRLYAHAKYVVYPSFYEGFGFPLLTALAYGRTVLARRSALLDEIADQCTPRGRLVTFDRREELVELLGRLVHGQTVPEHPLGRGLGNERPKAWRDVARQTLEFAESIARAPSAARWIARERAAQQLLSYRT